MPLATLSRSSRPAAQRGFTLVEVMVAVIILMVGLLGMFQAINLALVKNVENQLRQKGVEVAEQRMSDLKARPFANITGTWRGSVRVPLGGVFKNMSVQTQASDLAATNSLSKQVSVRVWWRYRGELHEHQSASGIGIAELATGN